MRNLLLLLVALCGICCWPQAGRAAMALDSRFTTESDHLSFKRDDGVSLTGKDLVGQSLMLGKPGNPIEIRIDGLDEHVDDTGRRTPLYRISARRHPDTAFGRLCDPDASGRDAALTLIDEAGHVNLTCTSGAEGKCILLGYRPWESVGATSLRDIHAACIRMIRADYGGDGTSHTRDGTLIAFRDNLGISDFPADNDMPFEAAWGPDGAVCVARPRIAEILTLDDLAKAYPSRAAAIGPKACEEGIMADNPKVLLLNRSR